jgi:hypothetical protein
LDVFDYVGKLLHDGLGGPPGEGFECVVGDDDFLVVQ